MKLIIETISQVNWKVEITNFVGRVLASLTAGAIIWHFFIR